MSQEAKGARIRVKCNAKKLHRVESMAKVIQALFRDI